MQNNNAYNLQLAKTLFENTYAARVLNDNKDVIGKLRIVPCLPLDRSLLPADAPQVSPFLLVIVDDADINKDNLIDFEERRRARPRSWQRPRRRRRRPRR